MNKHRNSEAAHHSGITIHCMDSDILQSDESRDTLTAGAISAKGIKYL